VRATLLAVVLVSCASSTPTTYQRGVYTAPASARPATPVGTGARTVGQPGPQSSRVSMEPNPRPTRVLPTTPEPGLWSAEEPHAALRRVGVLTLLLTPLPLPVVGDGIVVPGPAERCVATYHRLFLAIDFSLLLKPITTEPERDCFVAKLYDLCAKTTSRAFPKEDTDPVFAGLKREDVRQTRANTNLTKQIADAFKNEKCHLKRAFGEVANAWLKMFPNGAI
jgi:hypothetical protein